jgi:hypothetical protein
MSANLSQWQRRFMLEHPIAWLAGWHLALPAAACCLAAAVTLSTLRAQSVDEDRFALAFVLLIAIMVVSPLLLLLRSAAQAGNTLLTRVQTWQWFVSLTGVMALFVAQPPLAWMLRSWLTCGAARSPFGLDASETVVTSSIAMMFALGLVSLAVAHSHNRGRRWTAQFAVAAPPVLLMLGVLVGELLRWPQFYGVYAASGVLMIPVLLACRSLPVRFGSWTFSPHDLTVMATGPLFGVLIVAGLCGGEQYVRTQPFEDRANAWSLVWMVALATSVVGYSQMIFQLRPTRQLGERE